MKRPLRILVVFLCLVYFHNSYAQSIEFYKYLGDTSINQGGGRILQLPDKGYFILSGNFQAKSKNNGGLIFYRTNSKGDTMFSKNFDIPLQLQGWGPAKFNISADSKFLATYYILDSGFIKFWRFMCDSSGKHPQTLYNKYRIHALDSASITYPEMHVKYVPNECFYIYGQSPYAPDSSYVIWKIDTSGKLLWRQDYFDTFNSSSFNLTVFNNKLLFTSIVANNKLAGVRLVWMDMNGNVIKERSHCQDIFRNPPSQCNGPTLLPDSSIIMGVYGANFNDFPWPQLVKFNTNFDTLWSRRLTLPRGGGITSNDNTSITKIVATADSGIGVYWYRSFTDYPYGLGYGDNLRTYKANGDTISTIFVFGTNNDIIATSDKGYALTGADQAPGNRFNNTFLLKLRRASLAVGIEEPMEIGEGGISIYPNPAASSITLYTNDEFRNAEIRIYNLQGQLIQGYSHITGKEFLISRNNTPQGLYILQITNTNKTRCLKFAWD